MVNITINGQNIQIPDGQTILQAAQSAGITIPTLCYHKDLSPYGGCRLCIVDVQGARLPVASCVTPVSEGLVVLTETPRVIESRKAILSLIMSTYNDAGYAVNRPEDNELIHWANFYGLDLAASQSPVPHFLVNSDPNPFLWVDMNKCILCSRCVRACAEIQGRFVWGISERGYQSRVVAGFDQDLLDARCESCGTCVAVCPTGALDSKLSMGQGKADKLVTTTCTYCGVGCQLDLNIKDNRIIEVTSNNNNQVNGIRLCVKGRYGYDFVHHPDRLQYPMVREYIIKKLPRPIHKNESPWVRVDWDTALSITAERLHKIRWNFGSDSIGILSSAKCTNEENYLMNKLARQVLGTNNIDHCARLCHSSTVSGLATAFGSGAMSNSMRDIAENANSILIIGSNTSEQHPVLGTYLRQAVLRRHVKLIVADPRKIDMTEFAVKHLQQRPGTDIALINGIMHIILKNGWENKEYINSRTTGFETFITNIDDYPPEKVAEITGVSQQDLYEAAELFVQNSPMAVFWAMGITQHTVGVQNVITLANLQMLLGNMGIPGGGVNPLRGQNNVQGACDMGALPNVFPGYQSVGNPDIMEKFEHAWGAKLNPKLGMPVTEMIPSIEKDQIHALYIMGENPVLTDADTQHVRHCFDILDFLVLQEIFPSKTAEFADVLLPGVTFAEKSGTFTNTERAVQRVRPAVDIQSEARQDWSIIADLASKLLDIKGNPVDPNALYSHWDYESPDNIMQEIAGLTPSYAGINYTRLDRGEKLAWPVKDTNHPGTPILHIGQFTRGKGQFMPTHHLEPAETPDSAYPYLMTTGRVIYHWHAGEMTRRAEGLLSVYSQSLVELNPDDALKLGLNGSKTIRITSRRGTMEAEAWVTDRVPSGVIHANFHFPEVPTNDLTIAALDPVSKIPEFKICAVRIEAV
jgi:formate dehydrogenase alpha subunit